jgi:hypothetical protein
MSVGVVVGLVATGQVSFNQQDGGRPPITSDGRSWVVATGSGGGGRHTVKWLRVGSGCAAENIVHV